MKSWFILVAVAIVLAVAVSFAVPLMTDRSSAAVPRPLPSPTSPEVKQAPRVEVAEDPKYDFKVMAQENEGHHSWTFKNTGQGVLELTNEGSDCSCTNAKIGAMVEGSDGAKPSLKVPPGGSESIELTWKTKQFRDAYRKSARIGTNDPRQPLVTLSVEGTVYPAITVEPADGTISFGTVGNEGETVRKGAIYSMDQPEMKVTRVVDSNPGLLAVRTEPFQASGKDGEPIKGTAIVFTLKPGDKLGAFAEEVLLETDHPQRKEVRFPVRGTITGPVSFFPEQQVVLRDATTDAGGSKVLTVWVRGKAGAQVSVVKAPPGLAVDFAPIEQPATVTGSSKFRMTVRVLPGTPAGQIRDEIVLKTDHPRAAEIRLPVDIIVTSRN